MVLIGAFSLIRFLPSPATLPAYARFLPIDLSPEKIIGREPTATLPSSVVGIATVTVDSANCRDKPRGNGDKITVFYRGQELEVLGRNDNLKNPWWYVKISDQSGNCWLWGMTATMKGTVDEIPIVR